MKYIILIFVVLVIRQVYMQEIDDVHAEQLVESLKASINEIAIKNQVPSDAGLNISEYLTKYSYPLESHEVTTEDGYIITLHRIPSGSNTKLHDGVNNTTKNAVLFIPPLLCSSIDWVNMGPNKSLPLLLADLGYDIWLLNTRGTRYSMKHQSLNSSQAAFWDFSFHEKGVYDIAASIDYVLGLAGLEKLTLVGFSEGTSASMALTISKPQYNERLNLIVLLSPIGYMGGVRSPIPLFLVKYLSEIQLILDLVNIHGIPYIELIGKLALSVCSTNELKEVCANLFQIFCGYDLDQLDRDYMLVLLSDKPAGFSARQMLHYGQEIIAASFRQYDYGAIGNMAHYGTLNPADYDPSKITAPVAAYYGQNDFFAATADVEHLLDQIPNKADVYLVEYKYFSHLDFIAAKDVKPLLYDRVLKTIEKYSPVVN